MKKIIILAIAVVFTTGCNNLHLTNTKGANSSSLTIVTKHCTLSPFKSIVVNGNAEVELVNGSPAMDIAGVHVGQFDYQDSVVDQVLYITSGEKQHITTAKVVVQGLSNITVTDNVVIKAKNLKADKLIVMAKGYSTVNLYGYMDIDKIFQYGKGRINIDWVHGNKLLINSYDNGPICLAGVTDKLIAKLVRDAMLNARYLRAKDVTVFATDNSRAEVLAVDNLKAYATDNSSIYYYKEPKHDTVITKDSSNVLRLDWMK